MLSSYISISRSRHYFLVTVWVLLSVIFAHTLYFELFARNLVDSQDISLNRYNDLISRGDKYDVIAVGTSHTDSGLISASNSFFNYGRMFTWYPSVALEKVKHSINHASNLKVLLLEADHLDLFKYSQQQHSKIPKIHNHLFNNSDENNWSKYFKLISLQDDIAPGLHKKFFQEYIMESKSGQKNIHNNIWESLDKTIKQNKAKKRVAGQLLNNPRKIHERVKEYFASSILLARQNGVDVYLVLYPQTKEYFKAIHPINHRRLTEYITALQVNFGVKVLDYRNVFLDQEQYFANQDHLNTLGANVLTSMVFQDIHDSLR